MANDSALEQRIQYQLGSNKAIIIVKMILGDYCKKKKKKAQSKHMHGEGYTLLTEYTLSAPWMTGK